MDINIPALDNITEAAKEFLQKVITPPLEEVGLLLADQVKLWRFKNQVAILQKAEAFIKSKNIKTRKVSVRTLTPLLEYSSLEEEASLQDKWAALIANTVRENSGLDSTLFSYLLSQLGKDDAEVLETIYSASVNVSADGQSRIYIWGPNPVQFNFESLLMIYDNLPLVIDNLIRLRLVGDRNIPDHIYLTNLGWQFMEACKIH